jgi:hypothetical protein
MGSSRLNLQAQPKNIKKINETPKKNSYGGYPKKFADSTQNPKKIIETQNLPIRTKIFSKKLCIVP